MENSKNMRLDMAAGVFCALALIFVWLISSFELVTYGFPGFYEREYTKYEVDKAVNMEMSDILDVTKEMMAYLRGNRDNLHVMTIVGGQPREFFNDREIAHMEDVRNLFLGGLALRRIAAFISFILIVLLIYRRGRETLYVLAKAFQIAALAFTIAIIGFGLLVSTDFTKYFTIFHEIFFDNDLWLLNPATDLLINILPEPFFADTVLYIALTFTSILVITFIISTAYCFKRKKHHIQ